MRNGRILRPESWRPPDRHILLGVSHASGDPARHRNFEILAFYDAESETWRARVSEQNLNEQRGDWKRHLADEGLAAHFPTAALCLGDAVTRLITVVDQEAHDMP